MRRNSSHPHALRTFCSALTLAAVGFLAACGSSSDELEQATSETTSADTVAASSTESTAEETETTTCSYEDQPVATALQQGNLISVPEAIGGTSHFHFQVDEVDNQYSCTGLSWVQVSGSVVESTHATSVSQAVVFFVDGQLADQEVIAGRVSGLHRIDDDKVEVTYFVRESGPEYVPQIYQVQAESGALVFEPEFDLSGWGLDVMDFISAADVITADTESSKYIEIALDAERTMRCSLGADSDQSCEVSGGEYWDLADTSRCALFCNNYFYAEGFGNTSDMGLGWSEPATQVEAGKAFILRPSVAYPVVVQWDGEVLTIGDYSFDHQGAV